MGKLVSLKGTYSTLIPSLPYHTELSWVTVLMHPQELTMFFRMQEQINNTPSPSYRYFAALAIFLELQSALAFLSSCSGNILRLRWFYIHNLIQYVLILSFDLSSLHVPVVSISGGGGLFFMEIFSICSSLKVNMNYKTGVLICFWMMIELFCFYLGVAPLKFNLYDYVFWFEV